MSIIKQISFIMVILSIICGLQLEKTDATQTTGTVLWETLELGHALEISLVEILHLRRHALRVFLRKHLGNEFVDKNKHSFPFWCDEPVVSIRLSKLLKSRYPKKKKRNKIISKFRYPKISGTQLKLFKNSLNRLLHILRGPLPHGGYKYLIYSKSPGGKIGTQKLVARHTKDNPQQWQRTYEEKIYRIHMYSPSKRGMFGGNRDVWLERLLVSYRVGKKKKSHSYPLHRVLKRGESIDIDLPEIVDRVEATLLFACKKEHRGKAEFFVEFILAAQKYMIDSPDSVLIVMIKSFGMINTVRKTREELTTLLSALGSRMTGTVRETIKSTKIVDGGKKDQLQYFLYMLKDKNIERKELIKRFRTMFGF